jgi:carboxyl-terminal processing protease
VKGLAAAALAASLLAQSTPVAWRQTQLASFDEAWQTIHDTYYDPAFAGLDWEAVRDELRPRVEAAASADAARDVIREMLARLGRSHFGLIASSGAATEGGGPATPPFDVRLLDGAVVVTRPHDAASPAARAPVQPTGTFRVRPGDVLTAIDGRPVSELIDAAVGATARARAVAAWQAVEGTLRGEAGSRLIVRVRRPEAADRDVEVTRSVEPGEIVQFGNLPPLRAAVTQREVATAAGARVGFISFNLWLAAVGDPIASAVDAFRGHRALVFDLRGNPGGLAEMIRGVAGHVLDEPLVLGRMQLRGARLEFPANPRRSTPDGRRVQPFAGPVAILVDELTASTSECFAGGLQSLGRARVFGRQTMGQALPALTRQLASGDVLMYGIGDFETSTGQLLEGEGVIPDEVVPLSPSALAAGRDPDLEAALAWVDRQGLP